MNKPRALIIAAGSLALGLLGGYEIKVLAEGAPTKQPLFYSGTLEDNGAAANGDYTFTLSIYDAPSAGTQLCTKAGSSTVHSGRFRLDVSDCADELRNAADTWTEVTVKGSDGVERKLGGRSKIGAVPYALEAQHAVSASSSSGSLASDLQALTNRVTQLENASATKSAFQAIKRAAQMIPSSMETLVTFDDEQFDFGNEYDPTTSTFTSKQGGYYEFSCMLAWNVAKGSTAQWEVNMIVNDYERLYTGATTEGYATTRQAQLVIQLKAGDRVQCMGLQETANPQALNVSADYTRFEGRRFAP